MIKRNADQLEREAEQAAGSFESGFDHLLKLEIRLDLGLIEIELRLAQLLRIITPVVRSQWEVASLLRDQGLQFFTLGAGFGSCATPHLVQQTARGRRRLGHLIVKPVVGESRKAQELRAPGPQRNH